MYGINHLENSLPILKKLGNTALATINGSELANIAEPEIDRVITVFDGIDDKMIEAMSPDEVMKLMAEAAEVRNGDYDSRECCIAQLSNMVTDVARKNIYLAQNVVLPLVEEYTDILNVKLQASTGISNLAIRVVADNSGGILNSTNLIHLIEHYKDGSGNGYSVNAHKLHGNIEYLRPLLTTGSEKFDEFINQWYATNNVKLDKVLVDVYNAVFANSVRVELRRVFIELGFESALFSILLAKSFMKETPEGVAMPLEDYNSALSTVIAAGCVFLGRTITKYENNIRKGGLILKFPVRGREYNFEDTFSGENDILVSPDVYEEYLNQGGSPEAIIGSYLTSNIIDKESILAKKEELENAYDRMANAGRLNRLHNRLDLVKDCLHTVARSVLKDINGKFNENSPYTGVQYDTRNFGPEINEFIKRVTIHDVDDIYVLMRRFVCSIFFADTHVEELLLKIDILAKDSPDKDVNELAIIASIDFVVEWLVSQLTFETPDSGTY